MKNPFRTKKYLRQVTFYTVGVLLSLSMFFGIVFLVQNERNLTERIYEAETQQSQNTLLQIDAYIEQLLAIGNEFAFLHVPSDQLNINTNYWARTILQEYLSSFPSTNSYIRNIDLELDSIPLSPSDIPHDVILAKYNTFTIYTSESATWPYYIDFVTSYRAPYNCVSITVDSYQLSWNIFNYQDRARRTYLLTEDNLILLTNHRQTCHMDITEFYPDIAPLMEKASESALQTYHDYYLVLSNPDQYGFRILSLVPKDTYYWQFNSLSYQTVLLCLIFTIIVAVAAYIIIKKFYTPIKDTISLLNIYIPTDLQVYDNEIAYIRESIQKYITKSGPEEPPLDKRLMQLHSAQSAVMQHQINNHFLFNTLENIKTISISELGKNNEVEEAIVLLKTIVQEGINQKASLGSLSHELQLVHAYVNLMELRYPDVETAVKADSTLGNCMVFKFSIQPILENCFTHAFHNQAGKPKRIWVDIYREGTDCVISVSDNGSGLDDEKLRKIEKLLADDCPQDPANHVGIQNVHKRIVSVFGSGYGISVRKAEVGAHFLIRYPITDERSFSLSDR